VTVIGTGQGRTGKDFRCAAHIKAAIPQGLLALCGIAGDAHGITVATINSVVNSTTEGGRCRLTAEFSGRGLTCQHAGAPAPIGRQHHSPAAEHFMVARTAATICYTTDAAAHDSHPEFLHHAHSLRLANPLLSPEQSC
jgi:hypothetical protein